MFFFKKSKKISHKQASMIGLVLAIMSLLTSAFVGYILPAFQGWLSFHGVYYMNIWVMLFGATFYIGVQGLLLFGFPLYYVQDKKSHMTGLQILVYALLWMLALVALCGILEVYL